jgi:hypothetical protein
MLGDASDFTPLDMLAVLGTNALVTNQACKSDSMRLGMKGKTGEVAAWADFRFLGGVAAAAVAQFGGPMVRRAGHDLATGLLGSFVATETCRRHAIKAHQEQAAAAAAPAQIADQAPPAAAPAAAPAPAGQQNYAYGW